MEKEGFQQGVKEFQGNDLTVKTLVTDRHVQLAKLMKGEYPKTKHKYDIWHVAKSE